MKKALIIALICLIAGVLIFGIGWGFLQKHPTEMNTVTDNVQRYGTEEAPTSIFIDTVDSRIEILPIEGDEWRVECKDKEDLYHTVELKDGTLTVKQIDNRQWYDHIGIFSNLQMLSVTVYLPAKDYESLAVHSTSGSITVQEGFVFANATLQNTSGSITSSSRVAGALNVQNTSGSITVNGRVSGDLIAKNTSGSIQVLGGVNGKLNLKNGSGRIEVKNATPLEVEIENTSGGIRLENVVCQEKIKIENTSGSIDLEGCDAMSFDLKNTSGSIRASLLSAKTFDCRSTSGSVHTPKDGNGGNFRARSVSGSIRVTVVE